jgi:hypothetical protein
VAVRAAAFGALREPGRLRGRSTASIRSLAVSRQARAYCCWRISESRSLRYVRAVSVRPRVWSRGARERLNAWRSGRPATALANVCSVAKAVTRGGGRMKTSCGPRQRARSGLNVYNQALVALSSPGLGNTGGFRDSELRDRRGQMCGLPARLVLYLHDQCGVGARGRSIPRREAGLGGCL